MYTIYIWDTFDNETFEIGKATNLEEAVKFVKKKYGDRISPRGADYVDIVNDEKGVVAKRFSIC